MPATVKLAHRLPFSFFTLPLLVAALLLTAGAGAAAADEVTVASFVDKRVVQRQPTAGGFAADFAVAGTFVGAPSAVEARAVEADGGAPVTAWTVVDAAPAGGAWSGTLADVPQGGWYRVEARFADAPTVAAASAERFGVGVIVAVIGQSNNVKFFTENEDGTVPTPYAAADDLTWRYGYGEPPGWEYSRDKADDIPVSWGPVTGTGGVRLVNNLQAALGVPILILDFALDGTALVADWGNLSFPGWVKFAQALQEVGDVELLLWHQGAIEGRTAGTTANAYKAGLDVLYTHVTDLVGGHGTLPFLVAVQNRGEFNDPPAIDASYNAVRKAQIEWAAEKPYAFAGGNTVDLALSNRPGAGNGHFWASGYEVMADRYTHAVLHVLSGAGEPGVRGGRIAGATLQGNQVIVEIAHDQGSAVTVPNPAVDVEGFTLTDGPWVIDDGSGPVRNELPIASAVLSGSGAGNQVVLTLGATPAGPLRLRYLYGQNPFYYKPTEAERKASGNVLYDDFAYHPGRTGLPINGTTDDVLVATGPEVVTDVDSVLVPEGGTAEVRVRLSEAPAADVTVAAAMVGGGDPDLTVASGASLTFTPADWDVEQSVTLAAAVDGDAVAGTAVLRLTAAGYAGRDVSVTESDDAPSYTVDPTSILIDVSDDRGTFTVVLGEQPASDVVFDLVSSDESLITVNPTTLTFPPSLWNIPRYVTVTPVDGVGDGSPLYVTVSVDAAASDDRFDGLADQIVEVGLFDSSFDPSLVLHWPLDETGAPSTVADATGNGHTGTVAGGPVTGAFGALNTAFVFDEVNDVVSLPAGFTYNSDFTVSLWMKVADNSGSKFQYLFSHGVFGDANTLNVALGEATNNQIPNLLAVNFRDVNDPAGVFTQLLVADVTPAGWDLIDDEWHMVTVTAAAGVGARLYVDGVLADALATHGGQSLSPAGPLTIGSRAYDPVDRWLGGGLDDLRIFDRALSAAEVLALYELEPPEPGIVTVSIEPAGAVAAGAQWRLTTGPDTNWQESDAILEPPAGTYTVEFSTVAGWSTPASQSLTVASGDSATAIGTYVELLPGSVTVTLAPAGAVAAGAQWRLTSGPDTTWQTSGATLDVPPGGYTLEFSSVAGWSAPASQSLTVASDQVVTATGTYVEVLPGSVTVTLAPAEAVAAGAQWRLTSGPDTTWQTSGATVAGLTPGAYTVEFAAVADWTAPAAQTLTVTSGAAVTATGTYSDSDPSLLLWLRLDESAGTTAADSTPNGRNGTLAGGPLLGQPGAIGTAFAFDEVDDKVTVSSFAYPNDFTVSIWFRVSDNSGSKFQYLYSHGNYGDPHSLSISFGEAANPQVPNQLFVNFRDGNDASGNFNDLLAVDVTPAGWDLVDDQWHLVTFTAAAGDGAKLYVDGDLADTLPSHGGNTFAPATVLTLATRNSSPADRWLGGFLDDVRVYGRALSAAEVAALYTPPVAPLVAPQTGKQTGKATAAPSSVGVDSERDAGERTAVKQVRVKKAGVRKAVGEGTLKQIASERESPRLVSPLERDLGRHPFYFLVRLLLGDLLPDWLRERLDSAYDLLAMMGLDDLLAVTEAGEAAAGASP